MGVAPRRLWGWVPESDESEWNQEQVDWLLALAQLRSEYGEYGEVLADAMNDGADPQVLSSGYQYVPIGPKTNWAVKAVADAQDAFYKDNDINRNGHVWTVKRIDFDPNFKPE